jgi:hypothetical protein
MIADTLLAQIRSLEAQLTMLKAELKKVNHTRKSLADYYGVLKDGVTTEQEIQAAKIQVKIEPV